MIDFDGIERPDEPNAHMFEMPHSGVKKIKKKKHILNRNPIVRFFGYLLRIFVCTVLNVLFFFIYRFHVSGQKHRRSVKKLPAVVIGNHCHYMDVTLTPIRFMPRMLYITSIPENFTIPVLGGLIRVLGAVPIPVDLKGMRMFDEVINGLLADKKAVMFLPESSLWPHYRDLRPFKKGAFRYAVRNNAPILPAAVTIRNVYKSLKKMRYRLKLAYLAPVYPDTSLPEGEAVKKLMAETYKNMRAHIFVSRTDDIYTKRYRRQKAAEQLSQELP